MIFEKIREKLFYAVQEAKVLQETTDSYGYMMVKKGLNQATDIVNEVETEYNNDMVYQLAMKYALCLTQYGVDITEKLETATQNAMALEQAYIRGRQDECDRFSELRDRHNNGWIACSERLPEEAFGCLVTVMDCEPMTGNEFENILPYHVGFDGETWNDSDGKIIPFEVIAWQPLPEPYTPKGE